MWGSLGVAGGVRRARTRDQMEWNDEGSEGWLRRTN